MEEKTLTIEKVVFGGSGLARDNGQIVFVPFTLPGEKVRAVPGRRHKDYIEATAIEIMEPSPDRVPPDCQYFGRCGGCRISHANYEAQLRIKCDILRETLARNHIPHPEIQVIPSPPFGYRHRARLKYNARGNALGFYEAESHRIVDVRDCLCLTPALNTLLRRLRTVLSAAPVQQLTEIECYENDRGETAAFFNAPLPRNLRAGLSGIMVFDPADAQRSSFRVRFRDYEFPMRPDIFLQVNPAVWNPLVQEIENHFEDPQQELVELYAGAGFFTLPLSRRLKKIHACEENEAAVRHAGEISPANVAWTCSKVEDFVFPVEATAILVDPPRAGLHKKVVEKILGHPFRTMTYVSCDAASFARDVRLLTGYRITRLVLLDLFAQTHHFEVVALLSGT